jgi:nitroimidazol reductase NimA-like FMN-containing flavoprotein (pyridoxamine 5'-phosphate oxidase superfamily)
MSPSLRNQIRMDPLEIRFFLASHFTGVLGTVGKDGTPHVTTVIYAPNDDLSVSVSFYRTSQKAANTLRDQRVGLLIETFTGYGDVCGVLLTGRAKLLTTPTDVASVMEKVSEHLTGFDWNGRGGHHTHDLAQLSKKRIGLVLHPEKVASWDHGKTAQP